jgi:DNA-binding NarL/FixJ family response regulator
VAGNLTDGPPLAADLPPGGPCPVCGTGPRRDPAAGRILRAVVPPPVATALALAGSLSARERVVFDWLGQGYDNRSIARELNVSERTVKRHVTVILTKLRLESRLQAGLTALLISGAAAAGS